MARLIRTVGPCGLCGATLLDGRPSARGLLCRLCDRWTRGSAPASIETDLDPRWNPAVVAVVRSHPEQRLAAALEYAALGIPVYPLEHATGGGACSCQAFSRYPPGRCPGTAKHGVRWPPLGLSGGTSSATTDPERIRELWARLPAAGVAVVAGECSRLLVLDLDSDAAYRGLERLEREHGRTIGWRVGTFRGEHVWLRAPEGASLRGRSNWCGLEVKWSSGGPGVQVTAPPSWHWSGNQYCWLEREGDDVPPMPDWMVEELWAPPEPEHVGLPIVVTPLPEGSLGTLPGRRRFLVLLDQVVQAKPGDHTRRLRQAWFGAGTYIALGWISQEHASARLEELTRWCDTERTKRGQPPKHEKQLGYFRGCLEAGMRDDTGWATRTRLESW